MLQLKSSTPYCLFSSILLLPPIHILLYPSSSSPSPSFSIFLPLPLHFLLPPSSSSFFIFFPSFLLLFLSPLHLFLPQSSSFLLSISFLLHFPPSSSPSPPSSSISVFLLFGLSLHLAVLEFLMD